MLNRDALNALQVFPKTEFFSLCPTFPNNERLPQDSTPNNNDAYPVAYAHSPGKSPGVIFLPGFMSTMNSTKPRAIYHYCQLHGLEFTSLDYSGHDKILARKDRLIDDGDDDDSTTNTNNCPTISQWMEESLFILRNIAVNRQQIVVGSSMGAWIAILLAQYEKTQNDNPNFSKKVSGILGIASAPDFTSILKEQIIESSSASNDDNYDMRKQMTELSYCDMPTDYNDDGGFYRIYQEFLDDATQHYVLDQPSLDLDIPVTLIHGLKDEDIPYTHSEKLLSKLDPAKDKNELILVEDGDHRLSKPHELEQILLVLEGLRCRVSEPK